MDEEQIRADQAVITAALAARAATMVPQVLPWWKGRAILELRGQTAAVQAFIDAIEDPVQRRAVQAAWDGADFARTSPMVNAALDHLGYGEADKDQLFRDGNALTV